MCARRAVLAAEVDELQMAADPLVLGIERLEIALGLDDVPTARESEALGQAMDVRVHRKRRDSESLRHHDARALVPDAGQRLERLEIGGHVTVVSLEQELRELVDVP